MTIFKTTYPGEFGRKTSIVVGNFCVSATRTVANNCVLVSLVK